MGFGFLAVSLRFPSATTSGVPPKKIRQRDLGQPGVSKRSLRAPGRLRMFQFVCFSPRHRGPRRCYVEPSCRGGGFFSRHAKYQTKACPQSGWSCWPVLVSPVGRQHVSPTQHGLRWGAVPLQETPTYSSTNWGAGYSSKMATTRFAMGSKHVKPRLKGPLN